MSEEEVSRTNYKTSLSGISQKTNCEFCGTAQSEASAISPDNGMSKFLFSSFVPIFWHFLLNPWHLVVILVVKLMMILMTTMLVITMFMIKTTLQLLPLERVYKLCVFYFICALHGAFFSCCSPAFVISF